MVQDFTQVPRARARYRARPSRRLAEAYGPPSRRRQPRNPIFPEIESGRYNLRHAAEIDHLRANADRVLRMRSYRQYRRCEFPRVALVRDRRRLARGVVPSGLRSDRDRNVLVAARYRVRQFRLCPWLPPLSGFL